MSSKSRKGLKPEQLPPTKEAVVQHALRVYLQMTYWKALSNTEIYPRYGVGKREMGCLSQL